LDTKLETAVNDIMIDIIRSREPITKQLLIFLVSKHKQAYEKGLLCYDDYKLLNKAVSVIWYRQFNSNIEFIFSN